MHATKQWGLGVLALAAAISVGPGGAAMRAAELAVADAAALGALLRSAPGDYVVNGSAVSPSDAPGAVAVFVQPDVYGPVAGRMTVPIAVGVQSPTAWSARMEVMPAGGKGRRAAEADLSGGAGTARQTTEFALAPGEYDVTLALVAQGAGSVVRQRLTVPALPAATLASSPVVLGDGAATVRAAGPVRPFVFGTTQLTPAARNQFRQADRIHVACRVFGWKGDQDATPDLTVEYVFQEHVRDHLRFFNKTKPQQLNAKTLAKTFDGKSGTVNVGMTVPLASFPPGQFDLVVRIKDQRTQAMTVQKTTFVVRES